MAGLAGLPTYSPDYSPDWPVGNTGRNGTREDVSFCPTLFCYGNPGVGKSYIM